MNYTIDCNLRLYNLPRETRLICIYYSVLLFMPRSLVFFVPYESIEAFFELRKLSVVLITIATVAARQFIMRNIIYARNTAGIAILNVMVAVKSDS